MSVRSRQARQVVEVAEPFEVEPRVGFTEQIVVLPTRVEGDQGIYDSALIYLVKELKAEGFDAVFLHASSARRWQELRGDVPVEVLIAIGAVAPAVIDVIQLVLGRILGPDRSRDIELKWLEERGHADGSFDRNRLEVRGRCDVIFEELARNRRRSGERGHGASSGGEGDQG